MANQLVLKISATDLARNLASVIDQVRVGRLPMTITRGNQDIAQITPVVSSMVSLSDLAFLLKNNQLSSENKRSFNDDLTTIHQSATLPKSSWD